MTSTTVLNNIDFVELTPEQLFEVDGGEWQSWAALAAVCVGVAVVAVGLTIVSGGVGAALAATCLSQAIAAGSTMITGITIAGGGAACAGYGISYINKAVTSAVH